MKQALINCPSLANSSLLELEEDIRQFWNSGVRWFHIDIMDGHYVPNLCYPVRLVADLKAKYPQAIADVHMMVTDPAAYIEPLRAAGADYVSFHADSTHFVIRGLRAIREVGMQPDLSGGDHALDRGGCLPVGGPKKGDADGGGTGLCRAEVHGGVAAAAGRAVKAPGGNRQRVSDLH